MDPLNLLKNIFRRKKVCRNKFQYIHLGTLSWWKIPRWPELTCWSISQLTLNHFWNNFMSVNLRKKIFFLFASSQNYLKNKNCEQLFSWILFFLSWIFNQHHNYCEIILKKKQITKKKPLFLWNQFKKAFFFSSKPISERFCFIKTNPPKLFFIKTNLKKPLFSQNQFKRAFVFPKLIQMSLFHQNLF